ncbi:MAG: hypothetical protein SCH70_01015 [Candidatus Methanoperedens sp.]|nr:hypothetical protein [Candidatus Methanoperedens sp.]
MRSRNIKLHIEELVLHGFGQGDRYRIAEAVDHELARLFTEQGAPQSLNRGRELERLDGGAFEAVRGSEPETIGAMVARAVYGGLNR